MRLKKYIKEASYGKKVGIKRVAYMIDYPVMLKWEMFPQTDDDQVNYKTIENIAYKEAGDLRRKKIVDFHEDDFDVFISYGQGDRTYEANVKLRAYEEKPLMSALRQLKFKVKK